jgi:hypothetical protein
MMIRQPRSRASSRTSGSGASPLLAISTAAPSSIDCRWASTRLPTTTTSPAEIRLSLRVASIECTQTRPLTMPSSPSTSSPSRTSQIAVTVVGASARLWVLPVSRM